MTDKLSARQIEVLSWVAQGKSQQDVADILNVSPRTIEVHLRSIKSKLSALTTAQAVGIALSTGEIKLAGQEAKDKSLMQTNRLIASAPVSIIEHEGMIEVSNPGAPEIVDLEALKMRLEALRCHTGQFLKEAKRKQVPEEIIVRISNYTRPLNSNNPTYLLLDGPMSFLRGSLEDPYITEALDGGFIGAWHQLVTMHDQLRPFLLPTSSEVTSPDLKIELSAEEGIEIEERAASVLMKGANQGVVGESVVQAMRAAKDYFEAAKIDSESKKGLIRKGIDSVGGIVAIIVGGAGLAASLAGVATWAATPQGQILVAELRLILDRILMFFTGA